MKKFNPYPYKNRKEHDLIRGVTPLLAEQYLTINEAKKIIAKATKNTNKIKRLFNNYAKTATQQIREEDKIKEITHVSY